MEKGKFIVFEGNDGCGKTTMAAMSKKWLSEISYPHLLTKSPGGTPTGEKLREVIYQNKITPEVETLLFASDYAQLTQQTITPALEAGLTVLCDRYSLSTIAYQAYGRGLSLSEVSAITKFATNNLKPDLVIWLDIDPEIGLARKSAENSNRFEKESLEFHKNVRKGYYHIKESHPEIVRIDASDLISKVFVKIQAHLRSLLLSH